MTSPIYWALYVGVLAFWGRDKSPKQEDTLAMLDQAINMFVTWLEFYSNGRLRSASFVSSR